MLRAPSEELGAVASFRRPLLLEPLFFCFFKKEQLFFFAYRFLFIAWGLVESS